MKKVFALSIFFGLFIGGIAAAFDIKDELLIAPGETANRDIPFATNRAGAKTTLPVRSLYTGRVFNETHTLAAINYHETSDYDGVDIVVA
jgi:hypothetical protein